MLTAAYDPRLLPEQEIPLVIGKTRFKRFQQVISSEFKACRRYAVGRASGRNKNSHDRRSNYMPGPRTRMDNF